MTRAEFETWIEEHYRELYKVARRRVQSEADAYDALHSGLAAALANIPRAEKPWTYVVLCVRTAAYTLRRAGTRRFRLSREIKASAGVTRKWKRPERRDDH